MSILFQSGFWNWQANEVLRRHKKTFSLPMCGIQHKIPTHLEGFIPDYPYVIFEAVGDFTFGKPCNTFLIFLILFWWDKKLDGTTLGIQDDSYKLELPHIYNIGVS